MKKILCAGGIACCLILGACPSPAPQAAPAQNTLPKLVLQTGHSSPVVALAFSPDGRFLASAARSGNDGGLKLWDAQSGELVRNFFGPVRGIDSLAFSPDGRLLASASGQEITLWKWQSGQIARVLKAPQVISDLLWLPDGLLVGAQGVDVWTWNVSNGAMRHFGRAEDSFAPGDGEFLGDQKALQSDEQGTILSLNTPHCVTLWSLKNGQVLGVVPLPANANPVAMLALSPDGKRLAMLLGGDSSPAMVGIWNTTTGKMATQWLIDFPSSSLVFSLDGHYLIASDPRQAEIRWYNAQTGQIARRFQAVKKGMGGVNVLAFSPDGQTLATGSYFNPLVQIWHDSKPVARAIEFPNTIQTLFCSPDSETVVWGQDNGALYFWNLKTGSLTNWLDVHRGERGTNIYDATFSPDGKTLFVAANSDLLCLDATTGQSLRPDRDLGDYKQTRLALSPDGKLLATGGMEQYLRLWDAQTGEEVTFREPPPVKNPPEGTSQAPSAQSPNLPDATPSVDTTVKASPPEERAYQQKWEVSALAFSPDGKWLALGGNSNAQLRLFDVGKREIVKEFDTSGGDFVAFSPDGRQLVAIKSWLNQIEVFDCDSGQRLWMANEVCGAAFASNGRLWCRERNGWISLRDAATGKVKSRFTSRASAIAPDIPNDAPSAWLSISPNGHYLVGKSDDETVKIWDADSRHLLLSLFNAPLPDRASPYWLAFTPSGFYNGSSGIERWMRWRTTTQGATQLDKGTKWRSHFSSPAKVEAALNY